MEKIKKKRKLRVPVKKIILATIAIAGLVSVAVVAPNALQAIGYFSGNKKYKKYDQKYLDKECSQMPANDLSWYFCGAGRTYDLWLGLCCRA